MCPPNVNHDRPAYELISLATLVVSGAVCALWGLPMVHSMKAVRGILSKNNFVYLSIIYSAMFAMGSFFISNGLILASNILFYSCAIKGGSVRSDTHLGLGIASLIAYACGKLSVYVLFSNRIFTAFRNTRFEYSKRIRNAFIVCGGLNATVFIVGSVFIHTLGAGSEHIHHMRYFGILVAYFICDFALLIVALVLFNRSLFQMITKRTLALNTRTVTQFASKYRQENQQKYQFISKEWTSASKLPSIDDDSADGGEQKKDEEKGNGEAVSELPAASGKQWKSSAFAFPLKDRVLQAHAVVDITPAPSATNSPNRTCDLLKHRPQTAAAKMQVDVVTEETDTCTDIEDDVLLISAASSVQISESLEEVSSSLDVTAITAAIGRDSISTSRTVSFVAGRRGVERFSPGVCPVESLSVTPEPLASTMKPPTVDRLGTDTGADTDIINEIRSVLVVADELDLEPPKRKRESVPVSSISSSIMAATGRKRTKSGAFGKAVRRRSVDSPTTRQLQVAGLSLTASEGTVPSAFGTRKTSATRMRMRATAQLARSRDVQSALCVQGLDEDSDSDQSQDEEDDSEKKEARDKLSDISSASDLRPAIVKEEGSDGRAFGKRRRSATGPPRRVSLLPTVGFASPKGGSAPRRHSLAATVQMERGQLAFRSKALGKRLRPALAKPKLLAANSQSATSSLGASFSAPPTKAHTRSQTLEVSSALSILRNNSFRRGRRVESGKDHMGLVRALEQSMDGSRQSHSRLSEMREKRKEQSYIKERLRTIAKASRTGGYLDEASSQLMEASTKYSILVFWIMCSSLLSLLLLLLRSGGGLLWLAVACDSLANYVCVYISFQFSNRLYIECCVLCRGACDRVCNAVVAHCIEAEMVKEVVIRRRSAELHLANRICELSVASAVSASANRTHVKYPSTLTEEMDSDLKLDGQIWQSRADQTPLTALDTPVYPDLDTPVPNTPFAARPSVTATAPFPALPADHCQATVTQL